jgi:hypothetical protein
VRKMRKKRLIRELLGRVAALEARQRLEARQGQSAEQFCIESLNRDVRSLLHAITSGQSEEERVRILTYMRQNLSQFGFEVVAEDIKNGKHLEDEK